MKKPIFEDHKVKVRMKRFGFSLIEVVIATAIFATSIVAIIGLMGPLSQKVDEIVDSGTAARLTGAIQDELDRIGFDEAVNLTEIPGIQIVASADGSRARLLSGGSPPADNALDDATFPGIADRDRYFVITLNRQFPYSPTNSGSLSLNATVEWPFHVPVGPPTGVTVASGEGADPFVTVNAAERQSMAFFFSVRP